MPRRTPQGYQRPRFVPHVYVLITIGCLGPCLLTPAHATPLLNYTGPLSGPRTAPSADLQLRQELQLLLQLPLARPDPLNPTYNPYKTTDTDDTSAPSAKGSIKDHPPLPYKQLQQWLELVSYIRQQSIVDAAAPDDDVDTVADVGAPGNVTGDTTNAAGTDFGAGGPLYFGDQIVTQIYAGNITGQTSIDAVVNTTTTNNNSTTTTVGTLEGPAGANGAARPPTPMKDPTTHTRHSAQSSNLPQGSSSSSGATAAAADDSAAAGAASAGTALVPAGGDKGSSGKKLLSKRNLLSVSDSVGAAQNRAPVPTPAAGTVTPPHHKQQQQQAVISVVQAARRAANVTAVTVHNSSSNFTATEGFIQQGAARVRRGGGKNGRRVDFRAEAVRDVKPPRHRTAPAVHLVGSQQTGPVRVQPKAVRQQQRGSWAKCSWWNKIMTVVDAVGRVQPSVNGHRKRC